MRKVWVAVVGVLWCLALGGAPVVGQGDVKLVVGTITNCFVAADGTTIPWAVGQRTRDRVEACTVGEGSEQGWYVGDQRLVGTSTNHVNFDVPLSAKGYMFAPEVAPWTVRWGTLEIAGPDGTWVGPWVGRGNEGYVLVAAGTGAYAGWTLVANMPPAGMGEFQGVLYQGSLPRGAWVPVEPLPSPSE
jgi:hypothetical protein